MFCAPEAILVRGVGLTVNATPILRDLDWRVAAGERWVLLGANGSGKTSLLRVLAGYGYPSVGTVTLLGQTLGHTDLRELRRSIGWVHGDLRGDIPPYMSCLEVVVSGTRGGMVVFDTPDAAATGAARSALAHLGAGRLEERRFHTLSTGERQRVLIARALVRQPKLLLLDEPCSGLDPWAREEFLLDLELLYQQAQHMAVVYVTHAIEEITSSYQGLLMLAGGVVLANGPLAETLTQELVSRAFGATCDLHAGAGRYSLHFHQAPAAAPPQV